MPSADDCSHEETVDPLHADRRNFYKVEKFSRDGQHVNEMLFAGNSLARAQRLRAINPEATEIEADNPATKPGVAGVASFGQLTLNPTV